MLSCIIYSTKIKKKKVGNSLWAAVRLQAFTAKGSGLIPDRREQCSHKLHSMPQPKKLTQSDGSLEYVHEARENSRMNFPTPTPPSCAIINMCLILHLPASLTPLSSMGLAKKNPRNHTTPSATHSVYTLREKDWKNLPRG